MLELLCIERWQRARDFRHARSVDFSCCWRSSARFPVFAFYPFNNCHIVITVNRYLCKFSSNCFDPFVIWASVPHCERWSLHNDFGIWVIHEKPTKITRTPDYNVIHAKPDSHTKLGLRVVLKKTNLPARRTRTSCRLNGDQLSASSFCPM